MKFQNNNINFINQLKKRRGIIEGSEEKTSPLLQKTYWRH